MEIKSDNDEIRWQIIRAMLDEFPNLREKTKKYIREQESQGKT